MYGVAGILIVLLALFLGHRRATEVTFMRGLKKGLRPRGHDAVGGRIRITMGMSARTRIGAGGLPLPLPLAVS